MLKYKKVIMRTMIVILVVVTALFVDAAKQKYQNEKILNNAVKHEMTDVMENLIAAKEIINNQLFTEQNRIKLARYFASISDSYVKLDKLYRDLNSGKGDKWLQRAIIINKEISLYVTRIPLDKESEAGVMFRRYLRYIVNASYDKWWEAIVEKSGLDLFKQIDLTTHYLVEYPGHYGYLKGEHIFKQVKEFAPYVD